ncbi:MAG TPA: hypothetical protein VGY66_00830, partial [Gemmataceae bacterium]|nr:hypothetical protein [Gemmataceae bacterium]
MLRLRDVARQWSVRAARRRLFALWLCNFTQMLAGAYLLPFMIRRAVWLVPGHADGAWQTILSYLIVPFILLAPISAALVRRLPKHRLLFFAALCNLIMAGAGGYFAARHAPNDAAFYLMACLIAGTAVFVTTRDALLPEAAHEAELPLSRVVGWMSAGGAAALVLGIFALPYLHYRYLWPVLLQLAPEMVDRLTKNELPTTIVEVCVLQLLSAATALLARFPSPATPPLQQKPRPLGFFASARRIFAEPQSRKALLAQAFVDGLLLSGVAATFGDLLGWKFPEQFMF